MIAQFTTPILGTISGVSTLAALSLGVMWMSADRRADRLELELAVCEAVSALDEEVDDAVKNFDSLSPRDRDFWLRDRATRGADEPPVGRRVPAPRPSGD